MLEPRNAVETGILLVILGYPELMLIPMSGTIRIVVMTLTLLPLAVLSMMGIDGDSLFQYIGHIIRYFASRRKLHYRRVGYRYDPKQLRKRKRQLGKEKGKNRKSWSSFRTSFRLKVSSMALLKRLMGDIFGFLKLSRLTLCCVPEKNSLILYRLCQLAENFSYAASV